MQVEEEWIMEGRVSGTCFYVRWLCPSGEDSCNPYFRHRSFPVALMIFLKRVRFGVGYANQKPFQVLLRNSTIYLGMCALLSYFPKELLS